MWFLGIHWFPFWWFLMRCLELNKLRIVSFSSLVFEGDEIRAIGGPLIPPAVERGCGTTEQRWMKIYLDGWWVPWRCESRFHPGVNRRFAPQKIQEATQLIFFTNGTWLVVAYCHMVMNFSIQNGSFTSNGWISLVGCDDLLVFHQGMDLGKECEECQERGPFWLWTCGVDGALQRSSWV